MDVIIKYCVTQIEYNKEQKGPVSALNAVQGFLVTAIGQKVYCLFSHISSNKHFPKFS